MSIKKPVLKVSLRDGEEYFQQNKAYRISWISAFDDVISIILKCEGREDILIEENIANNGEYLWKVSEDIPAGQEYRIEIRQTRLTAMAFQTSLFLFPIPIRICSS
ncbi:MAG: hypothetical protein ACLFQ0_17970 [Cyclobacteriaceae bacterium]